MLGQSGEHLHEKITVSSVLQDSVPKVPYVVQESETSRDFDLLDTRSIVESEGAGDAGFGCLTRDGSGSGSHFVCERAFWEVELVKKTRRM